MDAQLQALLDSLVKSQFSDLRGSWANLQLQLPEKLLNDLLALALPALKEGNPWLAFVNAAHVKGSLSLEVKLNV